MGALLLYAGGTSVEMPRRAFGLRAVLKTMGLALGLSGGLATPSWAGPMVSPAFMSAPAFDYGPDALDVHYASNVVFAPAAESPSVKPAVPTIAPAIAIDALDLDHRIRTLMADPVMTGLSVAVVEKGELTFAKGYGETIKGSGDPVSADTVFRWASLSKGVAAAAVLSLTEDGHLSLSSDARAHAPSLTLPASTHPVTVEHVLSHRTGLVAHASDTRIEGGVQAKTARRDLRTARPLCAPGTCHSYQNVAFDAVAEMVETTTALPYKAVISERLFKPLGMDSASVTYAGLMRSKSWARPHDQNGMPYATVKRQYYALPAAAGVNSSVRDLAKWMRAQMSAVDNVGAAVRDAVEDGAVIGLDVQRAMQTPRVKTAHENAFMQSLFGSLDNARYGLGWRIYDYDNGQTVIGHRGSVQGYRALVMFDPEIQSGVAIMWNTPHTEPVGLQLEIMDRIYGLPHRDWMRLDPA